MKHVLENGNSPSVNPKKFKCCHCGCVYSSNERYEEYGIIKDYCPECDSMDIKEAQ